jgi:integrase/recombinase XerD
MATITVCISEFIVAKRADGLAHKTIEWYRYGLKIFGDRFGDVDISAITTNQIRHYVVGLREQYSESTSNDYTRQLHTFFRWCDREYGQKNPMRNIVYPQPPKMTERKQVDGMMIEKFLNDTDDSYRSKRDKAIVALLWDTAMRSHGIRNLKVSELNMAQGSILIVEKGKKVRTVFFTARMGIYIQAWLDVRSRGTDYLFHNSQTLKPFTSDGLRSLLKRFAIRVGIDPLLVSTHFFRHGSAVQSIQNGMDVSYLSDLMGHADENTTAENYLVYKTKHLKTAHDRFAPSKHLDLDDD